MYIHERFREVKLTGRKKGKCICGERRTRQKTFTQTLNPFNKMPDGRLKDAQDIRKELALKIAAWEEEPIYCQAPTYWEWTREQRKEYDDTGKIKIMLSCGYVIQKNKTPTTGGEITKEGTND